jgi:prevent-host-death family protein
MTRTMTATEAKAKFLSLLDDVSHGEDVVVTKHGRPIVRLTAARGPFALKGVFAGIAWTTDPNDDLLSAEADWEILRDDNAP